MSAETSLISARTLYQAACACLLGWSPLVAACAPAQTIPMVATGQRVVTGNAEYDRFFAELSDLLHGVEAAERELPDAQAGLARRLGILEAAPVDALGARLRERTAHLALEGLTLELEFAGIEAADGAEEAATAEPEASVGKGASSIPSQPPSTPTATLRTPGREPERRELRLLEVLAQAALSAATVYAEMGTLAHRTRPLEESAAKLQAELAGSFPDPSRRESVQNDLVEATALLTKLDVRARAVASAADTLISLLDEAANTAHLGPSARRRAPREASRPASPPPPSSASPGPPADRAGRPAPPKGNAPADPTRDFEP